MAFKDSVAVRISDTQHAHSAQLGIESLVAPNHALHLVAFQWPDPFRSRGSPIRHTNVGMMQI